MGEKLDEYLKKNLTSNFGPAPERSKVRTFESLKSDLVKCAEYEKTLNKVNLKFHINQGKLFDEVHGLWTEESAKGSVTLNWNDWFIENKLGSERNVRRKRELARFIEAFPRLQYVNISVNKFHRRKKGIEAMLAAHPEIRDYWKDEDSAMDVN